MRSKNFRLVFDALIFFLFLVYLPGALFPFAKFYSLKCFGTWIECPRIKETMLTLTHLGAITNCHSEECKINYLSKLSSFESTFWERVLISASPLSYSRLLNWNALIHFWWIYVCHSNWWFISKNVYMHAKVFAIKQLAYLPPFSLSQFLTWFNVSFFMHICHLPQYCTKCENRERTSSFFCFPCVNTFCTTIWYPEYAHTHTHNLWSAMYYSLQFFAGVCVCY